LKLYHAKAEWRILGPMSRENVEIVRQAIEAHRSDDFKAAREVFLALWDPSCEYARVTAAVEPQTYRGHDGIRRYLGDMADDWDQWRAEAGEILEVSQDMVVATVRFHAMGKDSGAPVEARLAVVFVLSKGKILRGHTYPSREAALEAVGLSE
jgi:ketosteroid isomerase-like protein